MSEPQKKQEQQKTGRPLTYEICWQIVRVLLKTIFPTKFVGRENVPQKAPFMVIGNHLSMVDPVLVAIGCGKHQIHFVGKKELAKVKFLEWCFGKKLGVIFIDRHNSDMEAMRASVKVRREGGNLGIFPEGTRYHEGLMTQMESGTALIALRSGVPVIPFYIPGKIGLFRRLTVTVGKPIETADLRAEGVNTETCKRLMERITAAYADMAKLSA